MSTPKKGGPAPGIVVALIGLGLTALVGLWEFARPDATIAYQLAGVALAILLLIGIFLLMRFAAKHGDAIGEARFDTRNKERSDGR